MPLDPRVSSPCNRSGSTAESATLAAVATAVWMIFVLLSTPTCAFIPKYHCLPFFVWCISGSRCCSRFLVEVGACRMAASTVLYWQDSILRCFKKAKSAGHATVVRLIENREILAAVERIVRRLNLSGLHGFDFILESLTGNAYLIEINPRATQVGHLTLGHGRNLPAALFAALTGGRLPGGMGGSVAYRPESDIPECRASFAQ